MKRLIRIYISIKNAIDYYYYYYLQSCEKLNESNKKLIYNEFIMKKLTTFKIHYT